MKLFFYLGLVVFLISTVSVCNLKAEVSKELLLEYLDFLVSETLDAYNADNYIKFYKYFAPTMDSITTVEYFNVIYRDRYKKTLGYFETKELVPARISLDYDFPVLFYLAKFSKREEVLIAVYFKREEDKYKITDLRFEKTYKFEHYQK